jgi:hypothetical protein
MAGKIRGKNHLARKSSPDGVKVRQEQRIKGYDKAPPDVQRGYHRPGSGNRKKLGRS